MSRSNLGMPSVFHAMLILYLRTVTRSIRVWAMRACSASLGAKATTISGFKAACGIFRRRNTLSSVANAVAMLLNLSLVKKSINLQSELPIFWAVRP